MPPISSCPSPLLSSLELSSSQAMATRSAAAAFFLTGRANFWGSAFHIEHFINAVRQAADEAPQEESKNGTVLIDVGAAPYNTVGGDISHLLLFLKLWKQPSGATILGFEPGKSPFIRLMAYVREKLQPGQELKVSPGTTGAPESEAVVASAPPHDGEWIVLKNMPASEKVRSVRVANQPFAGDNTASLEPYYQARGGVGGRTVKTATIDSELRRRGLANREVLILKVDVEGHEMSVLRGATKAIAAGRVPIILLEYGDKMSPAIWDGMKTRFKSVPAAPTPQEMVGPSLYSLQRWGNEMGYDTFLLGAVGRKPVMVPLTGRLWRNEYEVCRDKSQKWSNNGKQWRNFSAWNPEWSAVCWYDVALVLRQPHSPTLRRNLLRAGALPDNFCKQLDNGWYPRWIDSAPPENLCCSHPILRPDRGEVCHTFHDCSSAKSTSARNDAKPLKASVSAPGMHKMNKPKAAVKRPSKGAGATVG